MDADRFDTISRSLSTTSSRRGALRLLAGSVLGGLFTFGAGDIDAHDALKTCKKKSGKQKKTCIKKAKKHNATHVTPCTPNCSGKDCGDDGCGGSCGPCFRGSCQGGICICPTGEEVCNGACVSTCESFEERFPDTCVCCGKHNSPCGTPSHCCSNNCGLNVCQGRNWLEDCTWGAQCASGICDDGKCTCEGEVCGGVCRATCSSQEARNPITCACCFKTGFGNCIDSHCDCCCSDFCSSPGGCTARLDGQPCDFDAQCASRFGCNGGQCGGVIG